MFLNGAAKPKCSVYSHRFKKCFPTRGHLIHYWGPRVNIYDQKELRAYLHLCQQNYNFEKKEGNYEDSY